MLLLEVVGLYGTYIYGMETEGEDENKDVNTLSAINMTLNRVRAFTIMLLPHHYCGGGRKGGG